MSTIVVQAPSVQDLISTIHTVDYLIAAAEEAVETATELRVSGALAAATLKSYLIARGDLPSVGIRMLVLPYSEACMHLKVAGKRMWGVRTGLQTYSGVQLYTLVGKKFSLPITTSEAGWDMQ